MELIAAAFTSQHQPHRSLVTHAEQSLFRQRLYVAFQLAVIGRQKSEAAGFQMSLHCLMQQFHRVHSSCRISTETDGKRGRYSVITAPAGTGLLLLKVTDVKCNRARNVVESQDGRHLNDETRCYATEQTIVHINVGRRFSKQVGCADPVIADVDNLHKTSASGGSKTWNGTSTNASSESDVFKTGNGWTVKLQNIHCFLNINVIELQTTTII